MFHLKCNTTVVHDSMPIIAIHILITSSILDSYHSFNRAVVNILADTLIPIIVFPIGLLYIQVHDSIPITTSNV